MNFKEIAKAIINSGYEVVGIRTLEGDENYEVGDTCRESYEWDLEHDCSTYFTTGETAGGTCATFIEYEKNWTSEDELIEAIEKAYKSNSAYPGAKVVIAGDVINTEYGHSDEDEVRIEDAEVIYKLGQEVENERN